MPQEYPRIPSTTQAAGVLNALRKAETISSGNKSQMPALMQRIADFITEGVLSGEPGPADLAMMLPGLVPRALYKSGVAGALRQLKKMPAVMIEGQPRIEFVDEVDELADKVSRLSYLDAPYRRVSIKPEDLPGILHTQPSVSMKGIGEYVRHPVRSTDRSEDIPEVISLPDSRSVLLDGHHRASAHLLRNMELPVRAYSLEDVLKNFALFRMKIGADPDATSNIIGNITRRFWRSGG